ncbi:hypothetical protein [Modestobacter sp. I12A-02662]|uniref:hypothetical protein n=1 Tax=Modestobacter sp. I12A-02662 TaxID=1730496 RepID=UPI0034DE6D05
MPRRLAPATRRRLLPGGLTPAPARAGLARRRAPARLLPPRLAPAARAWLLGRRTWLRVLRRRTGRLLPATALARLAAGRGPVVRSGGDLPLGWLAHR